jgi:molybdate transport system substrate-binding protein
MNAAKVLINDFESRTGIPVRASYGSSGKLAAQIKHGAPFELFLSADQKMPDYLEHEDFGIKGSQFTYAIGKLAVCSTSSIKNDSLLNIISANEHKKIALANERLAPYGKAAFETLNKLIQPATSDNKWIRADNVAQVFQFLISGNVALAFVAQAQVLSSDMINKDNCQLIPNNFYSPIHQNAILLKKGINSSAAGLFMDYLKSARAREIIVKLGYH